MVKFLTLSCCYRYSPMVLCAGVIWICKALLCIMARVVIGS
jgi:hypothetical protein